MRLIVLYDEDRQRQPMAGSLPFSYPKSGDSQVNEHGSLFGNLSRHSGLQYASREIVDHRVILPQDAVEVFT